MMGRGPPDMQRGGPPQMDNPGRGPPFQQGGPGGPVNQGGGPGKHFFRLSSKVVLKHF